MFTIDKNDYIKSNCYNKKSKLQCKVDAEKIIEEQMEDINKTGFSMVMTGEELSYLYSLSKNLERANITHMINFASSILDKNAYNLWKLSNGDWVIIRYDYDYDNNNDMTIYYLGIFKSLKEACLTILERLNFYSSDFYDFLNGKKENKASIVNDIRSFYDEHFIDDIESYIYKTIDSSFEYDPETLERINNRDAYSPGNNFANLILEIRCKTLELAQAGYITDSNYYRGSYGEWCNYISSISLIPYKKEALEVLEEIKLSFSNINNPRKKHI